MRGKWCVSVAAFALVGGSMLAATGAAQASTHVTVRQGGQAMHLAGSHALAGIQHATSSNWSGYAVHTGTYSSVSASWTEPTGHCSGSGAQYSSFWVGLDGYSTNSVEQTGTDTDCRGGSPVYYGWYEMFPAGSHRVSHTVKPGDKISAVVTFNGSGKFTLKLTDSTQKWTATENKTLASAKRGSAEIIIEAPSSQTGELPLADFGTVKVTSSMVDGKTIGSLKPTKITMVDGGKTLDSVSALSGGTSFSAKWLAS
jgi:hypothetical protein